MRPTTGGCRHALLLLAGTAGLATGCSSGPDQSSPAAVLESAYRAVGEGDFTGACAMVDPEAKELMRLVGTCESVFAEEYPPESRAAFAEVSVDEDALDTSADVVVIPESAVTFAGQPSTDGPTTVVERDGKWWITAGAS
jgi:hypothetical protein